MTIFEPLWTQVAPPPPLGTDALPASADVAVIGAGVTGLAAARRLADAGRAVVVLEAARLGEGASAVNGGMAAYGLKISTRKAMARYGEPLGRELWQASLSAVDLLERIVQEEGIDCNYSRSGGASLGFNQRDRRGFAATAEWVQANLGFPLQVIAGDEMGSVVGSDRFAAALVDGFTAGCDPARYLYGLAAAAVRRGAALAEQAPVITLERHASGFTIETGRGRLRAGEVLLATNGYTGEWLPALRRRVIPIGSYIVTTEPLPAETAARLIPEGRMLWTSRRFLHYFRLTPDRRLLMGGRQNLSTDLDLAESARVLRATIGSFFPELAEAAITHSWTGKLGATFDQLPHIGRLDGKWYALGYTGHGLALGTHLGHEVGGLITGEVERSPFAEIPHPTRWYYRKRPWFLPLAARGFRLLDRLGR
ncbi:MAG: FAD-binding oxidoreductase [Acidimicrobiia bacterium]|nr:FAD-binding oxidoreductase [Acidimicrobiia bacterium]